MRLFGLSLSRADAERAPQPAPRVHVVESKPPTVAYDDKAMRARNLRRGMWVMKDGFPRAGILVGLSAEGIAAVVLVNADGTNMANVATLVGSLRQAYLDEIPASRIKQPVEALVAMGYARR